MFQIFVRIKRAPSLIIISFQTSTRAVRDKLRFYGNCKGTELLDIWENKGNKQAAKKAVDWSLYGGAPKNRPALHKKPTQPVKKMEQIADESEEPSTTQ